MSAQNKIKEQVFYDHGHIVVIKLACTKLPLLEIIARQAWGKV